MVVVEVVAVVPPVVANCDYVVDDAKVVPSVGPEACVFLACVTFCQVIETVVVDAVAGTAFLD